MAIKSAGLDALGSGKSQFREDYLPKNYFTTQKNANAGAIVIAAAVPKYKIVLDWYSFSISQSTYKTNAGDLYAYFSGSSNIFFITSIYIPNAQAGTGNMFDSGLVKIPGGYIGDVNTAMVFNWSGDMTGFTTEYGFNAGFHYEVD